MRESALPVIGDSLIAFNRTIVWFWALLAPKLPPGIFDQHAELIHTLTTMNAADFV